MNETQVVISLMIGAVPERKEEIMALWEKYHPEVVVAKDTKGITLNASKERIKFGAVLNN